MTTLKLFYATNRRHTGPKRFQPTGYDQKFSTDGMANLRFGALTVEADDATVKKYVEMDIGKTGVGNGEKLAEYLSKRAKTAVISAYPDPSLIDKKDVTPADHQGSLGLFSDLRDLMKKTSDVLIYIHGFNVDWHDAVGSALALQTMLGTQTVRDPKQEVVVVLFSWPSNGEALPWISYKSDRREADGSGEAVARAFLKLQDYLRKLGRGNDCGQHIHLLCHSMGNYLLQGAVDWMAKHSLGGTLARVFEHVFLCAPDVDENALELSQPLNRAHEIASTVTVYHNREDTALHVSDYTKGNPDRLGTNGAARPAMLHQKIHQVDCAPIVHGLIEHSYYLCGTVNADIRKSIDGVESDDPQRARERVANYNNVWKMKPAA